MSLFDKFFARKKNKSANIAKERLLILFTHEKLNNEDKNNISPLTWLPQLQQEILEVVGKYIKINKDDLKINVEKHDNLEFLEINVTLCDKGVGDGTTS